jgi:predicted esterase
MSSCLPTMPQPVTRPDLHCCCCTALVETNTTCCRYVIIFRLVRRCSRYAAREGVFDEEDLRRRADDLAEFVVKASAAYGIEEGSLVAVGFSNGANIASAMLLARPDLLAGVVLLAAMVPYAEAPSADLGGTLVIISNGDRDPMIAAGMTQQLAGQLRERGAEAVELPHPGGHQIYPAVLPEIRRIIADRTVPTRRSAE